MRTELDTASTARTTLKISKIMVIKFLRLIKYKPIPITIGRVWDHVAQRVLVTLHPL